MFGIVFDTKHQNDKESIENAKPGSQKLIRIFALRWNNQVFCIVKKLYQRQILQIKLSKVFCIFPD